MDKLTTYRRILAEIVSRHAGFKPSHGAIEPMPICDTIHDQIY